jgi:hypothetical protein
MNEPVGNSVIGTPSVLERVRLRVSVEDISKTLFTPDVLANLTCDSVEFGGWEKLRFRTAVPTSASSSEDSSVISLIGAICKDRERTSEVESLCGEVEV